jgi:hypothetical protein
MQEDVISGRVYETVQVGPLSANLPDGGQVAPLAPRYDAAFIKAAVPNSPAGMLRLLLARLDARHPAMERWNDYYEGRQPLAFASEKFRDAFGGRFRAFSSNFCALVVDGTRERMEVTGFTYANSRSAKRAWRIWQDNDMDAASQIAHTEALVKGIAYALVEPDQLGGDPTITIEDPFDAITCSDPRNRRRRTGGLKRWMDEEGHLNLVLYQPDLIWRLRSEGKWEPTNGGSFVLVADPQEGEAWPLQNRLGVVPLVPLPNRPRLRVEGRSEIDPVMSNQDAINKYRADALVAAEFAAFRQRWATGLEIPEDPKTGQPVEPFKAAVDRLWVVPPPDPDDPNQTEAKFGEFSATDLAPYQAMIESEIGAMASISRMPYHYLLGQPQSVPPSGESLKSSEAGLVAKVNTSELHFGEGWEEVSRLTLLAVGDAGSKDRSSATEWRDPETRNEAVRTQSAVLAYQQGIITQPEARLALGYQPLPEDAAGATLGTVPPGGAPGAPAAAGPGATPALPASPPAGGLPA